MRYRRCIPGNVTPLQPGPLHLVLDATTTLAFLSDDAIERDVARYSAEYLGGSVLSKGEVAAGLEELVRLGLVEREVGSNQ